MTDVERQYARAVFSLALENNETESTYQDLKSIIDALDEEAYKFFLHPKIENQEKHQVIAALSKNILLVNFLKVLIDNNRFNLIETIAYAYLDLINEMNEVVEVNVFTKADLSESNKVKLINSLEKKIQKKVKIITAIDDTIIGGIKIEYQGSVIDQTINASLDQMKTNLTGGN